MGNGMPAVIGDTAVPVYSHDYMSSSWGGSGDIAAITVAIPSIRMVTG